jgi:hypothetical protein
MGIRRGPIACGSVLRPSGGFAAANDLAAVPVGFAAA